MVKKRFYKCIRAWLCLMLLVGQGYAGLSPEATAFRVRLQESEAVEEYQKMEEWIFEIGDEVEQVVGRLEEALRVISLTSDDSRHRHEREGLSKRLLEEFEESWEAWMMAAVIQGELPADVVLREDGFERRSRYRDGTHHVKKRDRIRILQLISKARELAEQGHREGTVSGDELAGICLRLADRFEQIHTDGSRVLTDLDHLPGPQSRYQEYEERGPVLEASGKLLLPELRESLEEATTDDERIYWLRHRAGAVAGALKAEARHDLAIFWFDILGVHRVEDEGYLYLRGLESEYSMEAGGEFELHTLKDSETFVVGPEGPRRVTLPEPCRFVPMLREIALDSEAPLGARWAAANVLFYTIYQDRRQFDKAYDFAMKMGTRTQINSKGEEHEEGLNVDHLEPKASMGGGGPVAYGSSPKVFLYSQGLSEIEMELWRIDLMKSVENKFPTSLGRNSLLGEGSENYRENGDEFREWLVDNCERCKSWKVPIRMKPNRMQAKTPLELDEKRPGSYLLVRKDGEEWQDLRFQIYDVSVVHAGNVNREELDEEPVCYAVDPQNGAPLEGVEIRTSVGAEDSSFYTVSDHRGQLHGVPGNGFAMVRRPGSEWQFVRWQDDDYDVELWEPDEIQSFLTTNQPLYRPGQTVSLAGWLRRAPEWMGLKVDLPDQLPVRMRVSDPTGRRVWQGYAKLDEFGGFTGEFQLGDEIVLGQYRVEIAAGELEDPFEEEAEVPWEKWEFESTSGTWKFEVGEFRKPDFQVKVKLVENGDEFETVIEASYLSGEPVKGAAVKAALQGSPFLHRAYPRRTWDDLFESGYQWGHSIPRHLRGWREWAMWSSSMEWLEPHFFDDQPRGNFVSSTSDGVTGEDGKLRLKFHGKFPLLHRYAYDLGVTATVTEFTGRVVTGADTVVHTGRSYEVFARPLKGYYGAGEKIEVEVGCLDFKGNAQEGEGVLKFERMLAGKFEPVFRKKIQIGKSGLEVVAFPAPESGQYRCVFEGGGSQRGVIVEVLGRKDPKGSYGGVQIVPRDFMTDPGQMVELLVRTDAASTTVWVFEKQPNGLGRSPRLVTTKNHTAILKIPVIEAARPNFMLEALAFWKGRPARSRCLILVPDRESRLEVAMALDRENHEPGEPATVEVQVSDRAGEAVEASLALTVFDRALEDLAGGLPSTGRLRAMQYFEDSATTSLGEGWDEDYGELYENGVFSDRGAFFSETIYEKQSQFVKQGEALWRSYAPPELPNQVGGGIGTMSSSGGGMVGGFHAMNRSQSQKMEQVRMRKKLADRAYWGGALRTGKEGRLTVDFELPENLTSWRVQSWAFGKGRSFGGAKLELPVSKKLQVRPLLPRAAVVGDELVVGAMIQNLSETDGTFVLTLEVEGAAVEERGARKIALDAGDGGKALWRVTMVKPGGVVFRVKAASVDGELSDGFEFRVPVAAREIMRTVSETAVMGKNEKISELKIPYDPAMAGRKIQIRAEAHPAVSALKVLPDLVRYPYGCVEQTLNRFLPLLVAWDSKNQLGLDWDKMVHLSVNRSDSLGWISGRGKSEVSREAVDLSETKVKDMVHVGLNRLKGLQNDDGSWGWFSGEDSNARVYLTALAVRGLTMAKKAGQELENSDPIENGVFWLERWSEQEFSQESGERLLAKAAFVAWTLREANREDAEKLTNQLWKVRSHLPLTSQIHLALALRDSDREDILLESIRGEMDKVAPKRSRYYSWWNEPVERRACYLKLLVKERAEEGEIQEEIRGLLEARMDGIRWKSTRESGLCLEAIVEALVSVGVDPFQDEMATEVELVSKKSGNTLILSSDKLWTAGVEFSVDDLAAGGAKEIALEVTRRGNLASAVFLNAVVSHPSSDPEAMKPEEAGLSLERRYFRVNSEGDRELVRKGEGLKVGEVIEVVLRINSDGPREFLHLRDPIPAGLEPVMPLSGYHQNAYRESRTGESHFFISELSDWNRDYRYRLSVVTEGVCLALPAHVECMYSPEIRGRSEARKFAIEN